MCLGERLIWDLNRHQKHVEEVLLMVSSHQQQKKTHERENFTFVIFFILSGMVQRECHTFTATLSVT